MQSALTWLTRQQKTRFDRDLLDVQGLPLPSPPAQTKVTSLNKRNIQPLVYDTYTPHCRDGSQTFTFLGHFDLALAMHDAVTDRGSEYLASIPAMGLICILSELTFKKMLLNGGDLQHCSLSLRRVCCLDVVSKIPASELHCPRDQFLQ